MTWMLKNSRGKPDALITFSAAAVATVLVKVLLNGVSTTIGAHPISFGTIDPTIIAAVLVPTIGAYTAKRLRGGRNDERHEEPKP